MYVMYLFTKEHALPNLMIQNKMYAFTIHLLLLFFTIHGDVAEGRETMVDREEGRKGMKAVKTTAYRAKIIKLGGRCMLY